MRLGEVRDERLEALARRNADLDDFAARVAHDLQNPIAAIAVAGSLLRHRLGDASPEVMELVAMVEEQAAYSSELVSGMLALARSGTARRLPFELGLLVDEAARGIARITLENRCTGVTVVADRVAIRQAIVNLLANGARYATANGTATLTVRCEESGEGWRVLVADRGPGVAAVDADRIFSPFERGEEATHGSGSGLGLTIVAATARAHGGEAGYEPRPGGGSVFWFSLRRGEARLGSPTLARPTPSPAASTNLRS